MCDIPKFERYVASFAALFHKFSSGDKYHSKYHLFCFYAASISLKKQCFNILFTIWTNINVIVYNRKN